jgi:hypothetical protein
MHLHAVVKVDEIASRYLEPRHGRAMMPPVIGIGTPVVAG